MVEVKGLEYKTDNLYLAGYFLTKKLNFLGVTLTNRTNAGGQRLHAFRFTTTPDLPTHIEDFWNNQGTIHVQDYIQGLQTIKGAMRNAERTQEKPHDQ